jgi:hypothetical protein
MININEIITGEKIQMIANLYIGTSSDFNFNKNLLNNNKRLYIDKWNEAIDNPKLIFCYSHLLELFSKKMFFLKNSFILISHNSDYNIINNAFVQDILNNNNLIKWFGQNISLEHPKLHLLPIGIANSQWTHGNLLNFLSDDIITNINNKKNYIHFNFRINTNFEKRTNCYNTLKYKIKWLEIIDEKDNISRLASYKYCICPEGNGFDTHRLWECLYLKTIPIVLKNNFTTLLKNKYDIPIVLLDNWDNINFEFLINNYNDLLIKFDNLSILSFNFIIKNIIT